MIDEKKLNVFKNNMYNGSIVMFKIEWFNILILHSFFYKNSNAQGNVN